MTPIASRHWVAAGLGAMTIHALAAGIVLWQPSPPGAQAPGTGGIEVALGSAGGAPGSVTPIDESVEADTDTPPEEVQTVQPDDVQTQPQELEATEVVDLAEIAETVDMVEAEAQEPDPADIPEIQEVVEQPDIVDVEPVFVPPVGKPPPPTTVQTEPPPESLPPVPQSEAVPPPEPQQVAAAPPPENQVAATPSVAGAVGRAGTQAQPEAGTAPQPASTGGTTGHAATYNAVLLAWLQKHKQYPARARARRQEGIVYLYFAMDRDGNVVEAHIHRSSGKSLLDEEALALIRRAEPLPPPPEGVDGEQVQRIVPVDFFLR